MNKQDFLRLGIAFFIALGVSACANNTQQQQLPAEENQASSVASDPLEGFNRLAWSFNWDVLDPYLVRPVTVVYTTVMPQFMRTGLVNAVNNLYEPRYVMNNFLQGKGEAGFDSLTRFLLNSTVGLLGTVDVASHIGLVQQQEDFTEVLGVWGVDAGPFVMLPFLGPNDARGFTGDLVDNLYVFPMNLLTTPINLLRFGVRIVETRANLMAQEQQMYQAVDSYTLIKDAYIQNMQFRVTDGASANTQIDEDDLEDFEDFERLLEEGADEPNDNR